MGTLRYALLNALLSPLDEDAKLRSPRNAARLWLQELVNDSEDSSDFRITGTEETDVAAVVEAELKIGESWRLARLNLALEQDQWSVSGFEWVD